MRLRKGNDDKMTRNLTSNFPWRVLVDDTLFLKVLLVTHNQELIVQYKKREWRKQRAKGGDLQRLRLIGE